MTDEELKLAKQLVKLDNWGWYRGMGTVHLDTDERPKAFSTYKVFTKDVSDAVPDLSDPATKGILLHLIREAFAESREGDPNAICCFARYADFKLTEWVVSPQYPFVDGRGKTEGAALARALLAAWAIMED